MRLNPECTRDILLEIEELLEFGNYVSIQYTEDSSEGRLQNYSHKEILYHISQCEQSGLISNVHYYDGGRTIDIYNMTPVGHEFIENIRNDTIFAKTKDTLSKTGIFTLKSMTQVATSIATELIKSMIQP